MENITDSKPVRTDHLYRLAMDLLKNKNRKPKDVQIELIKRGLDQKTADSFIDKIQKKIKARKRTAFIDMGLGTLFFSIGLILSAAEIGYIFWGAVVYGIIKITKGIYIYTS